MRTTIKLWMMLLLLTGGMFSLTSCNDIDDGSYVAPITQYEKITGKWVLNSVTQVDETNQKTMDLTNVFGFDTFAIEFNTDSNGEPTNYTISGSAPAMLATSGSWKLENAFVNSDGSSAKILLNDKTPLTVTAVPGATKSLEFKFTRKSNGIAFVSYVYNLVPVGE